MSVSLAACGAGSSAEGPAGDPSGPDGPDGSVDAPDAQDTSDAADAVDATDATETTDASDDADRGDAKAPTVGAICSKDAWCWEHPSPQGKPLRGVWASGAKDVWAVGEEGTILHDTGGGFAKFPTDATGTLTAIDGTGADDIWITTDAGAVYHGDGKTFAKAVERDGVELGDVVALSASDVWVVGARPDLTAEPRTVVLHYDGGAWSEVQTSAKPSESLRRIWASSSSDVYLAGGLLGVHHFDGKAWSYTAPFGAEFRPSGVWGTGPHDVWVYGVSYNQPLTYHFDGKSWTAVPIPTTYTSVTAMYGTAPDDVYATTTSAIFHFDGEKFTASPLSFVAPQYAFYLFDIFVPEGGTPIAVGQPGAPLHLTRGSWRAGLGNTAAIVSFAGAGDDLLGVGGTVGWLSPQLLRRERGAWTSERLPPRFDSVGAIAEVAPGDRWIVGGSKAASAPIARFDGSSLTTMTTSGVGSTTLDDVWGLASDDVWIAGSNTLAHFDGTGFTNRVASLSVGSSWVYMQHLRGFASNDVWATGWTSTDAHEVVHLIAHWDGQSWKQMTTGDSARHGIWGAAPNDVWFFGKQLVHWNGTDFTTMATPDDRALYGAWGRSGADMYAFGASGAIAHWDGKAWSLQESGISHDLTGIWGDDGEVLVASEGGTILRHAL